MDLVEKMEEPTVSAPADGVRAFDEFGRQVIVPREEWRTKVIPGMVQEAWDDPDRLYGVILNSLNDGFVAEMTEAAEHLVATDTIPARGTCMWGIVLMKTGRLDEAELLLADFGKTHKEDGSVLVNLAKVYADQDKGELAKATLWHALEIEPNHDNGLGWYAAMEQERGGDEATRAVFEKVAAMPASWRAQIWLARGELNTGNLEGAQKYYAEAMGRAPRPLPPDLLMQVSGDLGAKGYLAELIALTLPEFNPEWHGMPVGNNLIKALVDTGRFEDAEKVKASLWALNRPDWKEALTFWDGEVARKQVAAANAAGATQHLEVGMLGIDGPIWLPAGSPARRLFHAKSASAPKVTFLGGSAETPQAPTEVQLQMADELGRMTRSLPLFFAEQVEMRTAAMGRAMVPWAVKPVSGFVVSGERWPDATAVEAVTAVPENASEYVVTVHVDAEVEPWTAMLAFIRTTDGTRIGELEREFSAEKPEGLLALADEVVELLSVLGAATASPAYVVPAQFASYLLRLEQMLAVRCATLEGVTASFLNGEHEILEGELALCLAEPKNVPARLLLAATYSAMERIKPEVARSFAERIVKLNESFPVEA